MVMIVKTNVIIVLIYRDVICLEFVLIMNLIVLMMSIMELSVINHVKDWEIFVRNVIGEKIVLFVLIIIILEELVMINVQFVLMEHAILMAFV